MRPNGVCVSTGGFGITGVDDIDMIDGAVIVPVIISIVYVLIGEFTGFGNEFLRMQVVAVRVVAAIIGHVLRHGVSSDDIERHVKLAIALRVEIVVYAAVVAISFVIHLIGHIVEDALRSVHLEIGEVHQDNQPALLPFDRHFTTADSRFSGRPLLNRTLCAHSIALRCA